MTTNLRTWPWAAGLVSLLAVTSLGSARGQEGQGREKTAVPYDPLWNIVHVQNGRYASQQYCQTCHSDAESHALRLAEDKRVLNLSGNGLTLDLPIAALYRDPGDAAFGATLEPVSDSLRAQLGIPAGRGLVVASLTGDGPAAESGLQENDILLDLADKPLASADDLSTQLKAVGEAPVPLRLLRAGKRFDVQVRPVYRVTIGPVRVEKTDFYVGIAVTHADELLRAHVVLPAGAGLVATQVVAHSPAEKAGVKVHDILLEMNGKPLDSPETLVTQVQATGNKATALKLLREGKPLTVTITPEVRKIEADPHHQAVRLWSVPGYSHPQWELDLSGHPRASLRGNVRGTPSDDPVEKRLDNLDRELKELRQAIEEVRDALKAGRSKGGD
jgi:hypothetical protein